ncbi:hypothetical protein HOA64_02100 [bacterium]|jgi:hypothetical protein|nr:hypothetical protein [bacterium]MBT7772489.1 hypothetical protein [bacterium]
MNWDFSQLLTIRYFFDAQPGGDFFPGFLLLIFFVFVMFLGKIVREYAKNDKYLRKSIKKKFWMFPFLGVIGIILVLSRFATVPFFSMRAHLYGILLLTGACAVWILCRISREYRTRLESVSRENKKRRGER